MAEEVTIRPATVDDLPTLRSLVTNIFIQKETLNVHLKFSFEAWATCYDELTRFIDLNTSMVADTSTDGIVAFFLCAPFDAPLDETKIHPDIAPANQVIFSLDAYFKEQFAHVPMKNVLHCLTGGTTDKYERKGISRKLRAATLERATAAGWGMAVVECTSPITQHLMRDVFGFTVGKEIVYDDFEHAGKQPFKGLKGSAMLLYKVLEQE
ncbi:hypothetical protein B0H34DRAFT_693016 [Crassisporium funariophilum]|nr:hypothetical protein B0H34DRAFT_693016 [Crassisporium funariophilum]